MRATRAAVPRRLALIALAGAALAGGVAAGPSLGAGLHQGGTETAPAKGDTYKAILTPDQVVPRGRPVRGSQNLVADFQLAFRTREDGSRELVWSIGAVRGPGLPGQPGVRVDLYQGTPRDKGAIERPLCEQDGAVLNFCPETGAFAAVSPLEEEALVRLIKAGRLFVMVSSADQPMGITRGQVGQLKNVNATLRRGLVRPRPDRGVGSGAFFASLVDYGPSGGAMTYGFRLRGIRGRRRGAFIHRGRELGPGIVLRTRPGTGPFRPERLELLHTPLERRVLRGMVNNNAWLTVATGRFPRGQIAGRTRTTIASLDDPIPAPPGGLPPGLPPIVPTP